ncbi:MAG: FHA domain-containing protein [Planctomycetes bacterium]|nr:FHA domain-containing protein [Planctomycetota bacterium]
MAAFLRRVDGAGGGRRYGRERLPFVVGRASSSNLQLDLVGISKKHFRIFARGTDHVLEDMKSKNGTRANGKKIAEHVLAEGDLIQVGAAQFVYFRGAPALGDEAAYRLTLVQGGEPNDPREIPLAAGAVVLGRRRECQAVLADVECSGRHCEIRAEGGGHVLSDLGSTNGTLVNGKKIERVALAHGDEIALGGLRYIYHSPALPPPQRLGGGRFVLALLGSRAEHRVPLAGERATIGCDPGDTFLLAPGEGIGPRQVELVRRGRCWVARELGGPAPLYVGGVRAAEQVLSHGDELAVGPYRIAFLNGDLPAERFLLTILGGTRGGEEVALGEGELPIGRHPSNRLVIDSPSASSHHARIGYADGAFHLEDLGSTNGTEVNGEKVEGKRRLEHGDRIEIAGEVLVFRSSARERPESLRRERFVLLPFAKGAEPLRLQGPSFAIGREEGNDLVLPSKKVSVRHALLVERDGRWYL